VGFLRHRVGALSQHILFKLQQRFRNAIGGRLLAQVAARIAVELGGWKW